jgi:hypothetical protein
MDNIKATLEQLMESLKAAWVAQMESPWVISLREKFDELPPIGQKALLYGTGIILSLLILSWPLSDVMTSWDLSSQFEERRQTLKDLYKVQQEIAQAPLVPVPAPPIGSKPMMDQKLMAVGIKAEQIRTVTETPPTMQFGAEMRGVSYTIERITIRQAIDVAYELEHMDPSYKLQGFSVKAHPSDPHFFNTTISISNYAPKLSNLGAPGGAILDALKKKNDSKKDGGEDL